MILDGSIEHDDDDEKLGDLGYSIFRQTNLVISPRMVFEHATKLMEIAQIDAGR